jgi:hypothetical protein
VDWYSCSYISIGFAPIQRYKGFGIPLPLYPTVENFASLILVNLVLRSGFQVQSYCSCCCCCCCYCSCPPSHFQRNGTVIEETERLGESLFLYLAELPRLYYLFRSWKTREKKELCLILSSICLLLTGHTSRPLERERSLESRK